jgi:hypothetical protein
MAAIYSNGGNRWNILGFNFAKRDALSSLYKDIYAENKGKLIWNSLNEIISANVDSEKVDQDGIFYYEHILHFFFE